MKICLQNAKKAHMGQADKQEKSFKEENELLNLNLQWKNIPYAEIPQTLAAWKKELTFLNQML